MTSADDTFATTRWTLVVQAGGADAPQAWRALEELCRIYWLPLYAYARRRGHSREDAEDLTQGFFAGLLARPPFAELAAERGRFRAFLLAALKHHLANARDHATRLKRGGTTPPLSLDWARGEARLDLADGTARSPDDTFDREWALALLEQVLARLRGEWERDGRAALFATLKDFLSPQNDPARYSSIAQKTGLTEGHLRVHTHRLRKRYRELLKEEIAQTLIDPAGVDEELRALMAAFG